MRTAVVLAALAGAAAAAALLKLVLERKRSKDSGKKTPAPVVKVNRASLSALPPLKNDLLLRAAKGQVTERAPVWVMRQAGR